MSIDEEENANVATSCNAIKSAEPGESSCESPTTTIIIDNSNSSKCSDLINLTTVVNKNSPLCSLELFTNNPTNYKRSGGRSRSSSVDSRQSFCSTEFSPTSSPTHKFKPYQEKYRLLSSPVPLNSNSSNNNNNCDHSIKSKGRFIMDAAPIPRKVPCVIVPTSTYYPEPEVESNNNNNNATPMDYCTNKSSDSEHEESDRINSSRIINYSMNKSTETSNDPVTISHISSSLSSASSENNNWVSSPASTANLNQEETTNDELNSKDTNSKSSKLNFGIDRILGKGTTDNNTNSLKTEQDRKTTSFGLNSPPHQSSIAPLSSHQFMKSLQTHQHHSSTPSSSSTLFMGSTVGDCTECLLLSKFGYKISSQGRQFLPTSFPNYGSILPPGIGSSWLQQQAVNAQHGSSPQQHHANLFESSGLISANGFGHSNLPSSYGLGAPNYSSMSSMVGCNANGSGRRKRSWSRAVFSNLQRKGLEKRFQMQKYITKPDRRQLAAMLGLTDAQVKVWFQNRRMKWRHTKEGKSGSSTIPSSVSLNHNSSTPASKDKNKVTITQK